MGYPRIEGLRASLLNAFRVLADPPPPRSHGPAAAFDEAIGPRHEFCWSKRALRAAAMTVAVLTLAALPAITAKSTGIRLLGLCWLALLLALAHIVAGRALMREPVVTVDALGITDRRLLARRFYWQDIEAFERADLDRTKVVEFFLKQPDRVVAGGYLGVRFGAWLQRRLDLPAVTINLFMIDASAADFARAVAEFRPGLLPPRMLGSARSSTPLT